MDFGYEEVVERKASVTDGQSRGDETHLVSESFSYKIPFKLDGGKSNATVNKSSSSNCFR
jgi:hypothetical protein